MLKNILFLSQSRRGAVLFIIFFCAVKCDVCNAQAGEWTWMNGVSGNASYAVYGTQGVAAAANTPEGFYEPCEWRDNDGAFWLYGGLNANYEILSNLWKYDPSINQWAWIKGPGNITNEFPVYGTQGVPSSNNTPGARAYGVSTWVDNSGDFWLLGGRDPNSQAFGDLWRYNIAANEWTWMQGINVLSDPGVYGAQTIPDPGNHPGGRSETCATWTDPTNNLWLFGGYGQDVNGVLSVLNDMWKYDINSNEWTWMRGATTGDNSGSYGIKGVTDTSNNPRARMVYTKWKDQAGNFWIFGGGSFTDDSYYNDVWKYEPVINKWTWMSGTPYINNDGTTDALCTPGVDLVAPARFENRTCWSDSCGNFWTFGGGRGGGVDNDYNDLWNFNSQTLEWTLVNGSTAVNQNGNYGTIGVSSPANEPPSRGGSVSWIGTDGSLWTWGGIVAFSTFYNDLWRYIINPSCPEPLTCLPQILPNFSASDLTLCQKFCISFYDSSQNNPTAWQWIFPGGIPSSSTDQNPGNICYQTPGIFDVTLITTSASGTDTLTLYNYITVYPTPPFPTITQIGYTLTSSPAPFYQWQLNATDIPGATNQSYNILQSGYYTVIVSDSNGCQNSFTEYVLISGINDAIADENISIYPNPSGGNFIVEVLNCPGSQFLSLRVENTLGQEIFSSQQFPSAGTTNRRTEIDLHGISPGVYFIEIKLKYVSSCTDFIGVKKKIIISK